MKHVERRATDNSMTNGTENKNDEQRPTPGSLKRVLATYAGGNGFAAAARMLGGFLVVRLMEPTALGLFQGISLVLGYLPFAELGILQGLNREMPYYKGKNEPERVRSLAATALAWALLVGTTSAVALLAIALWYAFHGQWPEAVGFAAVAVEAFVLFASVNYLETIYRTQHAFGSVTKVYMIRAAVGLALVAAIWLLGYYGLCLRAAATVTVGMVLLYCWNPLRIKPKFCFADMKLLMIVGLPILAVTQTSVIWAYINRTLILTMLGKRELGLYTLYFMMLPALNLLPTAVYQVVFPRTSTIYGQTHSLRHVVHYALRPVLLLTVSMIPVVAGIMVALPWAVALLLPKYMEGVSAAQWALLDIFVLCLMQVRIVFFTVKKQHLMMFGMLLGMCVYGATLAWLVRGGVYLEAFPQAMFAGRMTYVAAIYLMLAILLKRPHTSE